MVRISQKPTSIKSYLRRTSDAGRLTFIYKQERLTSVVRRLTKDDYLKF